MQPPQPWSVPVVPFSAAVYAQALQTVFGLSTAQVQDGVLNHRPHSLAQTLFRA